MLNIFMLRYKHDCIDVKKVDIEITNFVSDCLKTNYPGVFQHLQNIFTQ